MKFNKIILICLLLLALVSFGAVSAVDDSNLTVETSDVTDDLQATDIDENLQTNDESTSLVITDKTFNDYFDGEGRISDSVPEGSTLDFQGQINASDSIKAIYINKPVNIISSTKDASITLNTVNGTMGKENISNRFIIDGVSSITISDVIFNRTQMIISDSSNVILNNVKIISDNYRIIDGGGAIIVESSPLVKFENINGFTLNNSYIYVYNLGSRLMDCRNVEDAVFDNNIFLIRSDSIDIDKRTEKIIWFSDGAEGPVDSALTFTNNHFEVNYTTFSGGYIKANNILFENNTYEHPDITTIASASGFSLSGLNIIARNNRCPSLTVGGNGVVDNNFIKYLFSGSGSLLIYNNTIGDNIGHNYISDVGIGSNSTFYDNAVNGAIRVSGDNVVLRGSTMNSIIFQKGKNITAKNNYIYGLTGKTSNVIFGAITVRSTETYITNSTIIGSITVEKSANSEIRDNSINGTITIESSGSFIEYNVISAFDSDYAVYIEGNKNCINNEVSDNEIYSKWYCGDNAVSYNPNFLNFIEYNIPANQVDMFVNNTVDVFDYGENTTLNVKVPNVNGNVTIDVNGEKYVVGLIDGSASYVLTKYSLGFNKVTVIYYDASDDVWAIGHANFTVNKVNHCPVELVYGTMSEFNPSNINFILPEDADGTIFVSLTDGVYSVDIEQAAKGGNNAILLPGLVEGNYTISATFTSVKYVTNSSTGIISFVHVPVYKLTAKDVIMDYRDGSRYKVLVTKDGKAVGAGEIVKITFNGKISNVKTDKNGYAVLTLDAAPKTYTIKAVYNGVTKSSKVTIKNILKAKNISKKKAKTIKFSATLKTSKGKAIAGKKITFKIKGKNYSAKTNKKGVATVSLKNLKVGKHVITSKYGVCTVKNTVTIKK